MWLVHIAHRDRLNFRQFQREAQIARPHRANADVAGCDAVVSAFHASGEQGGGQRRGSAFEQVSSLDHWFLSSKNGLDSEGQDCPARNNLAFTGSGQTFPGFAGIFIASRITASRPSTPLAPIRRRTEGGLRGSAVARVSDVW